SERPVEIARAQVRDAQIDVDGRGRRQERDRALQARPGSREIARLAQGGAEERVAVAGGGIEEDALPQLGKGLVTRAAVPERDAGRALRAGRAPRRRKRTAGRGALLPQGDAERVVALALLGIELDRLLERGDGTRDVAAQAQRLAELVAEENARRVAFDGAPQV